MRVLDGLDSPKLISRKIRRTITFPYWVQLMSYYCFHRKKKLEKNEKASVTLLVWNCFLGKMRLKFQIKWSKTGTYLPIIIWLKSFQFQCKGIVFMKMAVFGFLLVVYFSEKPKVKKSKSRVDFWRLDLKSRSRFLATDFEH